MKILQINAVYGQGSTGIIVRDIEHLCIRECMECHVASPDPKVRESEHGYEIGNTLDHKLHALLCRINGMQAYFSRCATRRLLRYMEEQRFDIVHLHNLHSNYIHLPMLLEYLAKNDIKTIVTLHDCWFYTGGCFHYTAAGCDRWLNKCGNCPKKKQDTSALLFDRSAKILADRKKYLLAIPHLLITGVSDWISDEARRTFLKDTKVVTVHNGVDMKVFKPTPSNLRKELGLEDKYVILGPASKWLLPVNKPIFDYFVANMEDEEILLLFGAANPRQPMPKNVRLYGYTRDRTQLAQLYTMADVFANCSREDSLSLINVESQACGTPVVTFNATGPKETVDESGFTVSAGDEKALFDALKTLRQKDSDTTSYNRISFVAEKFEINSNYQKYLNLYKTL